MYRLTQLGLTHRQASNWLDTTYLLIENLHLQKVRVQLTEIWTKDVTLLLSFCAATYTNQYLDKLVLSDILKLLKTICDFCFKKYTNYIDQKCICRKVCMKLAAIIENKSNNTSQKINFSLFRYCKCCQVLVNLANVPDIDKPLDKLLASFQLFFLQRIS